MANLKQHQLLIHGLPEDVLQEYLVELPDINFPHTIVLLSDIIFVVITVVSLLFYVSTMQLSETGNQ